MEGVWGEQGVPTGKLESGTWVRGEGRSHKYVVPLTVTGTNNSATFYPFAT